jgi:hypothetical protein
VAVVAAELAVMVAAELVEPAAVRRDRAVGRVIRCVRRDLPRRHAADQSEGEEGSRDSCLHLGVSPERRSSPARRAASSCK